MFTYAQQKVGAHTVGVHATAKNGKPTVILVHGIGVSSVYFMPFARELVAQYQVIVLDLPGYGQTPKPSRPLTVHELGQVVAQFIEQQQVSSPVLIGHSMGCQVVAKCAQNYPAVCKKYILLSPTVYDQERNITRQAVRLMQDSFREPLRLNMIIVRDYLRMGVVRYLRISRYMIADHIEKTLPYCAQPGLIVYGTKDPIVPSHWAQKLADFAPNAQSIAMLNAPHVVQYKKAKELATVCRDFINQ